MNQVDLCHFDLNLLVVFDALMTKRSLTRAAERLRRTQSAVSHSLSRLRERFGDPLLIKGGARMQPTALALDLIEQARPMLGGTQRVLSPQQVFDPDASTRVCSLTAPDFMLAPFSKPMARLRKEAPGVSVEWTAPGDIARRRGPDRYRIAAGRTALAAGRDRWSCRRACMALLRSPRSSGLSRLERRQVGTRAASDDAGRRCRRKPVRRRSFRRRARANQRRLGTEFLRGGADSQGSDLLSTLPTLAVAEALRAYHLESREVPFQLPRLQHAMVWYSGGRRDASLSLLRGRLMPIVKRHLAG